MDESAVRTVWTDELCFKLPCMSIVHWRTSFLSQARMFNLCKRDVCKAVSNMVQRPDESDILEKNWWSGMEKTHKRGLIIRDDYFETVSEILSSQHATSKTPRQHYLLEKYEVLQCGDTQKLIRKRHNINDEPVYLVSIEKPSALSKRCHTLTGHGGRDKMVKELSRKVCKHVQNVWKQHTWCNLPVQSWTYWVPTVAETSHHKRHSWEANPVETVWMGAT